MTMGIDLEGTCKASLASCPTKSNAPLEKQAVQVNSIQNTIKKKKERKIQTEEDYLHQKKIFEKEGPCLNTENWLYDDAVLDPEKKSDRVRILHSCEKAYYNRDYIKCLELIKNAESLFDIASNDELATDKIREDFNNSGRRAKKTAKVERHIVDLLYIKDKCLQKVNKCNN